MNQPISAEEELALGFIVMMLAVMMVLALIAYIVGSIFMGRVFKKAGEPAWAAWVPIYNTWIMLKIGGQPTFWAVLALVPVVNIISLVYFYVAGYHIGLKLQKEGWFVLLLIFLPLVWVIWLGIDKSTWQADGVNVAGGFVPPVPPTPESFGTQPEPGFVPPQPVAAEPVAPVDAPAPEAAVAEPAIDSSLQPIADMAPVAPDAPPATLSSDLPTVDGVIPPADSPQVNPTDASSADSSQPDSQ